MVAEIHELHPRSRPMPLYLRVGHTGYRRLENLHAAGRLPINRAVIDAAHLEDQTDLLNTLRESGAELVLDPKMAELSTIGGFEGKARALPWANPDRPHDPSDFGKSKIQETAKMLARFSIQHGMNTVLAPTRPLEGARDQWLKVDLDICEELRRALNDEGRSDITIDYPIIIPYSKMCDESFRKVLVSNCSGIPCEHLWLRISRFGMNMSAAGVRKYINGARDFHRLGKPIISDGVGGLVGLGILAFGAAGGICHGVGVNERFDAKDWQKPRTSGGGGSSKRIYLPGVDLYLKSGQAREFFKSRGATALLACNDTSCCPRGLEDMVENSDSHFLTQRTRQLNALNNVPELRRIDHYLRKQLHRAGMTARKAERLNFSDTKVAEKFRNRSRRLDDTLRVLEDLQQTSEDATRSIVPERRIRRSAVSVIGQ